MNATLFFLITVVAIVAATLYSQRSRRAARFDPLPVRAHRHWYRTRAPRRFD